MTSHPEGELGSVAGPEGQADSPSLDDRFAAFAAELDDDKRKQPDQPEGEEAEDLPLEAEGDEAELPEGEDTGDEPEAEQAPAIKPPASWTAEEKAAFAELPRHLQETVSRREAERDKALYAKTQEAARVRGEVEQQAIAELQTYAQRQVQNLQALSGILPQIPERPPASLQLTDPIAWAEQSDYHDWAVAQHQAVQQQMIEAQAIAERSQQEHAQRLYAHNVAILQAEFPEYLDPVQGVQHRTALGNLATELGFSQDDLAEPTARDITALRKVADWKAKADKFDKLMTSRMEGVRAAKNAPKVSRPGSSAGRQTMGAQRLKADREAMRRGDVDAADRVFGRFV